MLSDSLAVSLSSKLIGSNWTVFSHRLVHTVYVALSQYESIYSCNLLTIRKIRNITSQMIYVPVAPLMTYIPPLLTSFHLTLVTLILYFSLIQHLNSMICCCGATVVLFNKDKVLHLRQHFSRFDTAAWCFGDIGLTLTSRGSHCSKFLSWTSGATVMWQHCTPS